MLQNRKEQQAKLLGEGGLEPADVKDYMHSVTVTVDLSHFAVDSFSSLDRYLAYALYGAIYQSKKTLECNYPHLKLMGSLQLQRRTFH